MPAHDDAHTGIISSSPVRTVGFVAPHAGSIGSPSQVTMTPTVPVTNNPIGMPPSPLPTINTLTSQLASISLSSKPLSPPRITTPSASGIQGGRSVSGASVSAQRETSASSFSSNAEYMPRTPSAQHPPTLTIATQQPLAGVVSSDEEEAYFSDPQAGFPHVAPASAQNHSHPSSFDFNKVILSAYLMKRSKGRGRKLWRKRWFYLTSQGLTYTKSHMVCYAPILSSLLLIGAQDSRALRFIPLPAILDALEFKPSSSPSESDSDAAIPSTHPNQSPPTRLASRRVLRREEGPITIPGAKTKDKDKDRGENEHTFRLITAKRTFVLCAPSEEDEIKWLAAIRALLNRERTGALSPTSDIAPRLPVSASTPASGTTSSPLPIPTITQQPPTPASAVEQGIPPPTRSASTSQGPPIPEDEVSRSTTTRNRSATFTAKSAVADVVRRFHPEQRETVH